MRRAFSDIRFDSVSAFYPVPQNLVLPYSHNDITIDFNAIQTAHPKLVKYKYKLEGYDEKWSHPTNERSATFGNVHEGTYTFYLVAQNPDEAWSKPMSYKFTVLAPWYRTWWAILVYVLAAIGIMLAFSKWRQQRLRREKAKLLRMVKERTAVVIKQKKRLEKEKHRSDELLLNILPAEVAEELKHSGSAKAKHFEDVTVLFTDFVDFTRVSERMSPQALIDELNTCFTAFDAITSKYNIEKIKTIGDAYLAVAGLPAADPDHALNVIRAAQEMKVFMDDRFTTHNHNTFQIRIGIHSGSVVAGIVGIKKFGYDIWGDTVNTAARMEQSSEAGKINISQTTYELVKDHFTCVYRGEIHAKNKGDMKMYFVEGSVVEAE
jgi:class 3 adenylate cyclase